MKRKDILGIEKSVWIESVILSLIVIGGLQLRYINLLIFPIAIYLSVCKDIKYSFYMLLFLLPSEMIIKMNVSSTSLFTYLMLIISVIALGKKRIINRYIFIIIMGLFCYLFLGVGNNYTAMIKLIVGILLFYIMVEEFKVEDMKSYIMAFSLGLLLSCLLGMYKTTIPQIGVFFRDFNIEYIGGASRARFSGLYLDPNFFSISAIIGIYLLLISMIELNGPKLLSSILILAFFYFGSLSYSKVFFGAFLLLLSIFAISYLKNKRSLIITLFLLAVLGGVGYYYINSSAIFAGLMGRFQKSDVSNGRIEIWINYFHYFSESTKTLLIGDGLKKQYYGGTAAHNTFIQGIFNLGIIGFGYFVYVLFKIGRYGNTMINIYSKRKLSNYGLLIILIIMICTLSLLTNNDLIFYCMLIWISFNCVKGSDLEQV